MNHKLFLIPGAGVALVLAGVLLFGNLNQNLLYYLTPTEALERRAEFDEGRRFRLGGQVLPGSLARTADGITFRLGDGLAEVEVVHRGAPPQLFREGVGAVVEGRWEEGRFLSDTLIVRHDEEYRAPPGPRGGEGEA